MSKLIIYLAFLVLLPSISQAAFDNDYNGTKGNIDIMQNFLDSPLSDIIWCGEKRDTVFLLSEKSTLYRSVDNGFSGHRLTEHLEKIGRKELANYAIGQIFRIIQSPTDKSTMIFLGTEGLNWITDDCGANFRAMNQGRKIEDFQFHPTERNWMLASAWTKCEDFGNEPCRKYKELFFTNNNGEKWDLIAEYVYDFSWGIMDNSTAHSIKKQRIIITHEPNAKGHQKLANWSHKLSVSYSDNFFTTTTTLVKGGTKFLLTGFYLFVVQVNADPDQGVNLLIGDSRADKFKVRPIELPVNKLMEHSYTILDTSEHSVFLHINHDGDQSRYGNIYVSDSTGVRFSLALKGNVRNPDGQCDFERVQGVDGIYLANVYDKDTLKKFKHLNTDNFPHQHPGTKKTTESNQAMFSRGEKAMTKALYSVDSTKRSLNDFKRTMVSFDKGAIWQSLTPPYKDSKGNRTVCDFEDEECSLHLHSVSSTSFGPFYTTANSLGLIIGTGNVGPHLSNRADEINTYLSRDAGLTWFEVTNGSHIYEIGDHGSIIVIAPDQFGTREIQYSWDEGSTWETLKISDIPIEVQNIIIEPSNTAEKFIIYGRLADGSGKGIVIAIDFTPLHKRWCVGHDKPDTVDSDYETWSPNGKITPHCLLGRKTEYVRRKRDRACFNSEEYERWSIVNACECTEENWECDYGYARDGSGPCLPTNEKFVDENLTPPEECDGYYFVSQGYRKVAGDSCAGGISHHPIRVPCPGMSALNSQNLYVLISLVAIVMGMIWVSNKGNAERVKDTWSSVTKSLFARLPKSVGKGPVGFRRIDEIPDSLRDDEDDFGKIVFEETEEKAEPIEDTSLLEVAKGKKMTEGKSIESANKHVPVLIKPGDRK